MSERKSVEANSNGEDWRQLCSIAAVEQNPEKLTYLVNQIIKALDARNPRLRYNNPME
jgi:hypothetical protein